jgi:hypothetical protein
MLRLRLVMPSRNLAGDVEHGRTSCDMAARLDTTRAFIGYGPTHNSEPGGDGESGGNSAVYVYDPDGHYVEFFHCMGTRDNYWTRHGARAGSQRI